MDIAKNITKQATHNKQAETDIDFTRAIAGDEKFDADGRYSGIWGKVKRRANPENFKSSSLQVKEASTEDLFIRRL